MQAMSSATTPGATYCLLIGAARPSAGQDAMDGTRYQVEREDRPFEATQKDLIKMVNWCASFVKKRLTSRGWERVYPLYVTFLVNDDRLIPSATSPPLTPEGRDMMQAKSYTKKIFESKATVRATVKSSFEGSHKNVIIFFSGHGALTTPGGTYRALSLNDCALGKLMHHVLVLPQTMAPLEETYTDEELTSDVVYLLNGRKDRNVYLVLHACNSGGMFRDWQLETANRKENGLSIALFASAAGASTSQWNSGGAASGYVSIFTTWAQPGETLNTIQGNIVPSSLAEAQGYGQPGHSPCLITSRRSMGDMMFLPD